jgi:hypothetical protein
MAGRFNDVSLGTEFKKSDRPENVRRPRQSAQPSCIPALAQQNLNRFKSCPDRAVNALPGQPLCALEVCCVAQYRQAKHSHYRARAARRHALEMPSQKGEALGRWRRQSHP